MIRSERNQNSIISVNRVHRFRFRYANILKVLSLILLRDVCKKISRFPIQCVIYIAHNDQDSNSLLSSVAHH